MRLWLFRFTQEDRAFLSARVAARTRSVAVAIMGQTLGRPMIDAPYENPEPGTILSVLGRVDSNDEGIVSAIRADGELMVSA